MKPNLILDKGLIILFVLTVQADEWCGAEATSNSNLLQPLQKRRGQEGTPTLSKRKHDKEELHSNPKKTQTDTPKMNQERWEEGIPPEEE